ncbi:HdeD family acid-resistance protein [Agromyces aerolatus]|uniref:HdeD family acid-resistance protein n=1 Tax=Agromyces sp. LY-1074 TaxID=3074080 RepID=UPI0028627B82|nr:MULTISPECIES: DUF308 domain-containing protein [unclassified Agromyces]MDR5699341.1 DUF308 domain-containing protein [Agromyces sp. LY-1074]MDR5705637.1 DUF308 domain-containing protein [Agromyces sp. LY-1358]
MAEARADAVVRAPYWAVPVARGALAIVPAVVITFSQDHSPTLGLAVFGVWAIVSGLFTGAASLRLIDDRLIRALFAVIGLLTAIAGLLALITPASLAFLVVLVISWAAITGIAELIAGLRARGRTTAARDWVTVGAATALAAVVFLIFPFDSVSIVGLFGAYLVIVGVLLVIGGFSLKWGGSARAAGARPEASGSEQS